MQKEKLFEYIRKEEVIIWAGAGFSKYAGYPSGAQLAEIIYNHLSPTEQQETNSNYPLDYLSEDFVRIKDGSRKALNKILKKTFSKTPESTAYHSQLATIPHFKTIITTNYDALFELAYGDNGNKLFQERDMARWDKNKINILKIHGDLSKLSSLVITRQDYSKFYNKNKASPMWATVIEKITTNVILFLGYGYEDPNVWAIFEHIDQYIGKQRKDAFFVAPSLSATKIKFLKSKGIVYIDLTAEIFLNELLEDIKKNIFKDFHRQIVSADTFRKFSNHYRIRLTLTDSGNGFALKSIGSLDDEPLSGNAHFTFSPEADFPAKYKAFFEQSDLLEFEITPDKLTNFHLDAHGLTVMDRDELSHISIKKTPVPIEFDLAFLQHNYEINNLRADVYRSKKSVSIKIKIHSLSINIVVDLETPAELQTKFNIEHEPNYSTVKEEIEVYTFIKLLFSQEIFTVFFKNGNSITKQMPAGNALYVKDANFYIGYFNKLREVEAAFQVRFKDFYGIDQDTVDDLTWLVAVVRGEQFESSAPFEFSPEQIDADLIGALEKINESDHPMDIKVNTDWAMLLHGQRLAIPSRHIHIPVAKVVNLNELKSGADEKIKLVSGTGTIYETFGLVWDAN